MWCVDATHLLTVGLAASSPVVFGGNLYLVGGLTGTGNSNLIFRTTMNSDGSIGSWTSQSMTGVSATSVAYAYAFARANPSSASTNPGNLYIFGGCTTTSGASCSAYTGNVYKCNIQSSGAIASCSTSSQLQIGTLPGGSSAGLAIMSGTTYANYVYLIGGVSPDFTGLDSTRYAKIDSSNNIVAASGSAWVQSSSLMSVSRRNGAAFGYNGYLYMVGGYDSGSGVLPNIEFVKINVSDGSLIGDASNSNKWNVSEVQISQTWGLSVPVSNSYAYVIGGCTTGASPSSCSVRTDTIQTFQLYNNDSGAPAGFSTSANTFSTAANRVGVSGAVLNGYLYAAGGCTSTGTNYCTTATNNVSYAALDTSGSVGSWSSTSANLPANRAWGKLRAAGGTLYYIGGQSDTPSDFRTEVYYGTPSSGNVSSWSTATTGLPNARTNFGASVWNNRLYVVGGQGSGTGCSGGVCNTVYVSPQLNSGGNITSSWSTSSTSFNVARSGAVVMAYANNLYVLGGYDGTNLLSDTQYSQINTTTGDAGSWSYSTSLPKAITQGDGFAANGYIYIMGGQTAVGACNPVTLVAPMSANTTIASGNNPTGIGAWYETNQRYTGSRFGNAAVYSDGKAYIYGGSCDVSGTVTYASPVTQQTTLLSQPQVAKYSIMIDTDSDVFPTHWLLNGTDNSIGARWQLKYRSMTNPSAGAGTNCSASAMSTWGQETNFGNVTLGLPGVYTAKDGSGTNTNCARYYYFNVTVDVSQAFGYPDDVSWGPTITDLTVHYSADPAKRLLHGRTFVGGLQQPIDTPYYTN
jgi:N-acetylneuraminic acid mutarotase